MQACFFFIKAFFFTVVPLEGHWYPCRVAFDYGRSVHFEYWTYLLYARRKWTLVQDASFTKRFVKSNFSLCIHFDLSCFDPVTTECVLARARLMQEMDTEKYEIKKYKVFEKKVEQEAEFQSPETHQALIQESVAWFQDEMKKVKKSESE